MNFTVFIFQTSSSFWPHTAKHGSMVELTLQAVYSDRGLCGLSLMPKGAPAPLCCGLEHARDPKRTVARFEELKEKLLARLNGQPAGMTWSEFDLRDQPRFHVRVWKAMHAIPFGRTATYGEIAKAAGSPLAVRACGQACGANPILLFIPCHRVVSASGLGGFGCGVEWKKRFLALEGVDWHTL
jgi:methylated-DNA-[protein]-cysteine S-methyltransferase